MCAQAAAAANPEINRATRRWRSNAARWQRRLAPWLDCARHAPSGSNLLVEVMTTFTRRELSRHPCHARHLERQPTRHNSPERGPLRATPTPCSTSGCPMSLIGSTFSVAAQVFSYPPVRLRQVLGASGFISSHRKSPGARRAACPNRQRRRCKVGRCRCWQRTAQVPTGLEQVSRGLLQRED